MGNSKKASKNFQGLDKGFLIKENFKFSLSTSKFFLLDKHQKSHQLLSNDSNKKRNEKN
jgi:hypothetical protein